MIQSIGINVDLSRGLR